MHHLDIKPKTIFCDSDVYKLTDIQFMNKSNTTFY
jgi:hypothetical protein